MPAKRKPRIGLALGSGGARGWCHIGVLRALADIGVKPDVVSGASMGALVGAIYAGDGLDALEDWALALTPRTFFRLLDINLSSGGLVEGAEILRVVNSLLKSNRIEDQNVPLALVATDMATGREAWLTKGDIGEAVRASVALPGVISPFRIEDRWFLDGGLTNPLPVSACQILGADVVIAVNPNGSLNDIYWSHQEKAATENAMTAAWRGYLSKLPPALASMFEWTHTPEVTPQYLDVIANSIDIMTDGIRRSKLAGHPPHVLMDARLAHMSIFDFHRAEEAIAEGRRIVEDHAEDIRRYAGL